MSVIADEQRLAAAYYDAMYDAAAAPSALVRWKMGSTGRRIANDLAAARTRSLAAWQAERGVDPDTWPLPHPPAVLWLPDVAVAVCLRCSWLDRHGHGVPEATTAARRHALEYLADGDVVARQILDAPLPVWPCEVPDAATVGQP